MTFDSSSVHLEFSRVWDYRQGKQRLTPTELMHLAECKECARILAACQLAKTYDDAAANLPEEPR